MIQISKRFEFAAAHKYWDDSISEEENLLRYGIDAKGKYGHGHNFIVYVSLSGHVNPDTGMIEELSNIKYDLEKAVFNVVDHRFLNGLKEFEDMLPTPENIVKVLFELCSYVYTNRTLDVSSVELIESPAHKAIRTKNSTTSIIRLEGVQVSLISKEKKNDGRHINQETIKTLSSLRKTSSSLQYLLAEANKKYNVLSVKKEYDTYEEEVSQSSTFIHIHKILRATHCLQNPKLSESDNDDIFGRCQFVHGHDFDIRISLENSDLTPEQAKEKLSDCLEPWQYKSLNEEVPELAGKLCSCETIIFILKENFLKTFGSSLKKIVLQETPNNRFELRC